MLKFMRCLGVIDKLLFFLDDFLVGLVNLCLYFYFIYCSRNMIKSKLWCCFCFLVIWYWNWLGFSFKSFYMGWYVGVRRLCCSFDFLFWCNFIEVDFMLLRLRLDWWFELNELECFDDILIDFRIIKWVENCSLCFGSCSFMCWLVYLIFGRMYIDIIFYDIGNR